MAGIAPWRLVVMLAALLATTILVLSSCSTQKQVRLVLLPDIQTYSRLYPDILRSQTQWAVEHADSIDFVLQQGDMTDHNIDKEWAVAASTLNMMDDKVPYAFVMGNHDLGKNSNKRDSQLFNNYFPYAKYSKMKNFGGAFEEGKMDNVWYTFKAAGLKWLILCLEFGPRTSVLDWAGEIVKKHPHHKVIINTHAYMYSDDTRMGEGDRWLPQKYGLGKDTGENAVNNGEQMWDKLVSKYPNILFVFSGHVLNSGVGTLVSIGDHGNKVFQMLANFQDGVKGTNRGQTGFLRIVDIDVKKQQVRVKTYSPYLKEYKNLNSVLSILQLVVHFGYTFVLLMVTTKDLGSAIVFAAIFAVMLIVAGVRLYWFLIGGAAIARLLPSKPMRRAQRCSS